VAKDGKVVVMDKCIVIKTKVLNKYNTTSLVDGGATDSVLNVDWYTQRGIDWKSIFQVRQEMVKSLWQTIPYTHLGQHHFESGTSRLSR
jgi:hypothetical protein